MRSPTRCGLCEAPAAVVIGVCRANARPDLELWRRPTYRCTPHTPSVTDWIGTLTPGRVLIVEALTAAALCECGLPADHRTPPSGIGRPCLTPAADRQATLRLSAMPGVPA